MKKLIAAAMAFFILHSRAYKQELPAITIYGRLDTALRYTHNIDGKNDDAFQMVSGGLNPGLLGLRGDESLSDGVKAIYKLESGFSVDTGRLANQNVGGGTIFGRQAYAGFASDFGNSLHAMWPDI